MDAINPFRFSQLIAFVLPGFVGTFALAQLYPSLEIVSESLIHGQEEISGPIFIFVLVSLTLGVSISAIRTAVWDRACKTLHKCIDLDYSALSTKEKIEAYNRAVEETYRYFQFSGTMGIALIMLAVGRSRYFAPDTLHFDIGQLFVYISGIGLLLTSYFQYKECHRQLQQVLEALRKAP